MPIGGAKVGLLASSGVAGGARGVYMGGSSTQDTMAYITIDTLGDATDFGNLAVARDGAGIDNGANDRGCIAGGDAPIVTYTNIIEYITISSVGNAADFGDISQQVTNPTGVSNATNERGIRFNGNEDGPWVFTCTIEYFTISSLGNTTDFGDTQFGWYGRGGNGSSNGTNERGIVWGGLADPGTWPNPIRMDYITINSTGNSSDFGDEIASMYGYDHAWGGCGSNSTNERAFKSGGYGKNTGVEMNTIQYVTITSTGNAIDFGDLLETAIPDGAVSSGTNERAVIPGLGSNNNTMDYFTINSLGNSSDFGGMTENQTAAGVANSFE